MKTTILSLLCSSLSLLAMGQTIVGTVFVREAYIVNFENISTKPRIKINIEDDYKDIYAIQQFTDTTLVFKDTDEKKKYDRQEKERQRTFDKKRELEAKLKTAESANKTKEISRLQKEIDRIKIPEIDINPYITNRNFLKVGMKVEINFERINNEGKNITKLVTVITDFNKEQHIQEGILEKIGEVSIVDGRLVKLEPGIVIEGGGNPKSKIGSYKGKKFANFSEMQYGMELDITGQNKPDGILYIKKGIAKPNDYTDTDARLALIIKKNRKISNNILQMGGMKYSIVNNKGINEYINGLGKSLIPAFMKSMAPTEESFVDFKFYVLASPVFNACAFPDGSVFINSGLLLQIENPSQLAAIIGHEIAHVAYRHGRKSYDKNRAVKTGEDILTIAKAAGMDKEEMLEMAKAFGGPLMTNLFSRSYENQADRNGLTYMSDAGFDPREAPKIWEILYQKAKAEEEVPDSYIAEGIVKITKKLNHTIYGSHPQALERYRNLNLILAQSYQQKDFAADKEKFDKQTIEYRKFKDNLTKILKVTVKK